MIDKPKLTGKGGPGRGQGRHLNPNKKLSYGTRLPRWLVKWLREQKNAASLIEKALIKQYGLNEVEPVKENER